MSHLRPGLAGLLWDHPFSDHQPLLFHLHGSLSAGEARRQASELADQLADLGVPPGAAVVVRLPSSPGFVTAMFGVWAAGGVLVASDPRQPPAELERMVATCRPAAMVDDSGLLHLEPDPPTLGQDAAFVTWTSGTTGMPKAILHTHSAYLELLDRVLGPLRGGRGPSKQTPTPNLVPVPLSLNAGIYNVCFGLRAGAPVVLMERFSPRDFAELVRRHSVRSTVLPPAAMVALLEDPAVGDLAPLRYVRSITAPLPGPAARRFQDRFGVVVLNGYGQAELGEVIGWTAEDARRHPDKLGAAGRPHPGVRIKVVDESGRALGPGQVGELAVRPPRMAAGYLDGASLEDRVDPEGFVRTGDLARVDDDGFVWIEGRLAEVINRGGNKVVPEQVEQVLAACPGVREVAVAGVPEPRLGEVPVAFFVGDADPAELERACRRQLSPYKVPVAFERVQALPRSEVGKVLRRQLAASWRRD